MGDPKHVERMKEEKADKKAAADTEIAPEQVREDGGEAQDQALPQDTLAAGDGAEGGGEGERQKEQPKPRAGTPFDDKRMSLARKFSEDRKAKENPDDYTGDHRDLTMTAGKLGAAEGDEPQDHGEGGEPEGAKPEMFELVVNGKKKLVTREELIATAQKVEAAEEHLEHAKKIRNEAAQSRTSGQDDRKTSGRDQSDNTREGDHEGAERDAANQSNPGDDLLDKVKIIQFGEPEEAAQALGEIVQKAASEAAIAGADQRLFDEDIGKGKKILAKAKSDNEELFKDADAAPLIVARFHREYAEDLKNLGLSEEEIQKATREGKLPDYHRILRVKGYEVRDQQKIADSVVKHVSTRLGYSKESGNQSRDNGAPAPRQGAPRVVQTGERTQRKQELSPQPSRSGQQQTTQPRAPNTQSDDAVVAKRLKAVQEAQRARGQRVS